MTNRHDAETAGVLVSGGLDSCILVGTLLRESRPVQPIYIQTGLCWQAGELPALRSFLQAIAAPGLRELVVLQLPLADLYENHWSMTGTNTPNAESPDEAVFLPGRNALLLVKAAVWCQLNGIRQLLMAPLGTSPFEDAGPVFLAEFQAAMNRGSQQSLELKMPFAKLTKQQVMQRGRGLPLELAFSCISPINDQHCGVCNKCAERKSAFATAGLVDLTKYGAG